MIPPRQVEPAIRRELEAIRRALAELGEKLDAADARGWLPPDRWSWAGRVLLARERRLAEALAALEANPNRAEWPEETTA